MLRFAPLGFGLMTILFAHAAAAQGKPDTQPESTSTPPVELKITKQDGKAVCSPAELRLPANSNVTINIISQSDSPVMLTSPNQFKNDQVLHHDGDLAHAASGDGYTVKQNGKGVLKLRTLAAGEQEYGCASINNQKEVFRGKLILSPPSG
ncbi:anaerobic typically selenocysteine-containing protein [Methylorubrum extorquens]|jgi:hypothetical protein|uniref:anaerobic typically selenocysteine-containing protein n=1 Tax=Methylorubrum extorquens TaxID=408 RepID=UPI0005A7227A|nr:anaerobic typically selenocysteine-containing protein [Methylorubrum extorquens]KQP95390.1 anaerobic typically selenocysteine-containing protein [Methylobacterium sp. Leaf119]WIU39890.1 cupredoxin domain-containing protein [Methylorubrum extorquens]